MKKFWAIDDQSVESIHSDNDCEQHFRETVERTADDSYVVRLPFRKEINALGISRPQAERRFYQLERRLDQNPEMKKQQFNDEAKSRFDGSSKSSSGHSLNDLMMIGPPVQDTLFEILLRFRMHQYVFTANVPKMYRQVRVSNNDTKFQRILWRDDRSKPLQEIKLLTVAYGTVAAPFLVTRVLNQLAVDEQEIHPEASKVLLKCVYVDDVLSGADTIEKARELQNETEALLANTPLK
ncbi:uncharacterized protein LOC134209334 [Armigeres subalbatus]|uniref:uncharacterized protein LOC134209334 n=1 Tax=Armigeres subalbatus TaxID=124917 RepID=UPI002ED5049D